MTLTKEELKDMTNYKLERFHQQLESIMLSSQSEEVLSKVSRLIDITRDEIKDRCKLYGGSYWSELQDYIFFEHEALSNHSFRVDTDGN